jgi:beta-lactamase class A
MFMTPRFLTICSVTLTLFFAVTAFPGSSIGNTPTTFDQTKLQTQLAEIASAAKGRVGVAARVLETGDSISLNPGDHFPMQSVYKLPIGMAVMNQVDSGKIKLDQVVRVTNEYYVDKDSYNPVRDKYPEGAELTVKELMGWMLMESDGAASDVLMKLAGGPDAVNAYLKELKIIDIVIRDSEKQMAQDNSLQYRNWATPEAAVALLSALFEKRGLSEPSRTLLLKLMSESHTGPKRLKGLLPAGTVVAHKTGSSGTHNGITAVTNDIGIVTLPNGRHLAIAVFVSDSPADQATREGVIAKVARAIWEKAAEGSHGLSIFRGTGAASRFDQDATKTRTSRGRKQPKPCYAILNRLRHKLLPSATSIDFNYFGKSIGGPEKATISQTTARKSLEGFC